jgi:[ribosomal protein S18]-alanine N-acetyltransferase
MIADVPIELATTADVPCIATLSRDLIEHGLPWTWRPARVARAIADADTNVAVVRDPTRLAAFGIMSYLDDDAHLLLFAVSPARQRQGVGSALLMWLERVARAAGAHRIRVEARWDNTLARSFYSEHGYHELQRHKAMYSQLKDGVRLSKTLRNNP